MSHSQVVCGYSVTAVGNQTVANLATLLAAVSLDFTIPLVFGLLPINDVTTTNGQIATRSITLQFNPAFPATATATLFPGETGGPIQSLGNINVEANGDYAGVPVISFAGGNPAQINNPGASYTANATATAQMQFVDAIILNPGSGYTAATKATILDGGPNLKSPSFVPATIVPVIIAGGKIGGITITNAGFGYSQFAQVQLTDVVGGGSGAIVLLALGVAGVTLFNPGDYQSTPNVVFTPLFKAMNPDTGDQKSPIRGCVTRTFEEAIRSQVIALEPVVT